MNLYLSFRAIRKSQPPHILKSPFFRLPYRTYPPLSQYTEVLPVATHSAHELFDRSSGENISQFNHLLFDLSRDGRNYEAINLFLTIRQLGLAVERSTISCILKVCGYLFDQCTVGRQVHCYSIKCGLIEDVSVRTSLVNMYMKKESSEDGRRVFDEMGERNVVSWTSLLAGYVQNGMSGMVLELFDIMQMEGTKPNPFTITAVLGALADGGMVEKGVQVHAMVVKNGYEATRFVCNSLINMYLKSGMVRDARAVFDGMLDRDSVTWNGLITGYAMNGLDLEALYMFYCMRLAGIKFTQMTFFPLIKICANIKEMGFARQLHCQVLQSGFEFDRNIRTALIVAYCKCSEIDDAFKLFSMMYEIRSVVSWTAMISGYLQNGGAEKAAHLFCQMSREGIRPNDITYSTILTAQPTISPFQIHAQVIKSNYEKSPSVGTALLNAYVKLGNIDDAVKAFEYISEKDIITWSAMVAGFAQIGDSESAVEIFVRLMRDKVKPNEFTFSSVINACAAPTAGVTQGKLFHACSIKFRLNNALCVSSALVTMYAKRGNIESANEVFQRQGDRDLVSWNSMIFGYAQHGQGRMALEVFKDMQRQNLEMDAVTFTGVISACTHAGLVDEGQVYFNMMVKDQHIEPTVEMYSCMVDLYSRSGMLEKAMDVVNGMPYPAGANVWLTLLAACHVHRNLELGKLAAEKVISLQPQHSAPYVLLSNLCAAMGDWQGKDKVRKLMNTRRVKKQAGYSWIDIRNKTYSFLAGDLSHPQSDQIYSKLEELTSRLKDAGYQADTNYVLQDVEEEHKETILSHHSERLAISFGLIATPPGTPLQIVKNLRVCGDCHNVIKLISMIEGRYIVVRDSNRFHHFKGGLCSCGDHW